MTGDQAPFGYVMARFVEDAHRHAEKIYLSLSRGEDPARWFRLNGGEPILESARGTTGLRDPHLVRSPAGDRFYLVATDLRVFGGDDAGWGVWSAHGSRSIMVWETGDLVNWSDGRLAEVAPRNAGMAWAPESIYDDQLGEYVVTFSSNLFDQENDPGHTQPTYSRTMYATTKDFVTFSPARVYLDTGSTTIDTTMIRHGGKVFRFHKDNGPAGRQLYADVVSSLFADDAVVLRERIGREQYGAGRGTRPAPGLTTAT
ncbi:glycoside hydrolase family 43 protein [Nonomuraea sp. B19D2]|uniref:glycoside hydrolase family 43 protein n=1 Tax=Nonomuraea sp. B19D2 TaxID=3159561 RepID=UPI0032DBE976